MRLRRAIAGVAGLVCAAGLAAAPANAEGGGSPSAVVPTDRGLVRGVVADDHRSFAGIPYAAPPVGDLRWQEPAPAPAWPGVRDASKGPRCAQPPDPNSGTPASRAEDCLYLNVTTPTRSKPGLRPVVVWVHGGGFRTGAGNDFDPVRMSVRGDVVVVSVNYRLGIFGFFGHRSLGGSGGFGLADQQAALGWVRRNAAFFGGDPSNVSIFGESAGGDSVCAQLASPSARGLFDRAILHSGTCTRTNPVDMIIPGGDPARTATWKSRAAAERTGAEIAERLGCGSGAVVECLRKVPVDRLMSATGADGQPPYWSPVVGSEALPLHPADALESGRFNRVPVLVGTTKDEGTLFAAGVEAAVGKPMTPETYRGLLAAAFGPEAARVEATYPVGPGDTPGGQWAAIITDRAYVCPNLRNQRVLDSQVPTYAFEFADQRAPLVFDVDPSFPMGAYHGAELVYLFDLPGEQVPMTPQQRRLSERMLGYWTRFAATGDPNQQGAPAWPRASERYVQSLAPGPEGIGPVDLRATHRCDLWADLDR